MRPVLDQFIGAREGGHRLLGPQGWRCGHDAFLGDAANFHAFRNIWRDRVRGLTVGEDGRLGFEIPCVEYALALDERLTK